MISICCPSRGRPHLAERMIESARRTAGAEIEILLYLNSDDPRREDYQRNCRIFVGPDVPPVMAWNILAKEAQGNMLMHCGDDVVFETKGWAKRFQDAAIEDGIYCIVTHDGREDNSWPHFTVGREWIDTLGYFCAPWFFNWCSDIWTTGIAKSIGRLIVLDDIMLRHKKVQDETWARVRRVPWNARDRQLYKFMSGYRIQEANRLKARIDELSALRRSTEAVSVAR